MELMVSGMHKYCRILYQDEEWMCWLSFAVLDGIANEGGCLRSERNVTSVERRWHSFLNVQLLLKFIILEDVCLSSEL